MTAEELIKWQRRHGLTQVAAAKALALPISTYRHGIKGRHPISPVVERLTKYIDRFKVQRDL